MVKSFIASELPLDIEVTGHLGAVGVRIRSVSHRSCTVEHLKQVRVSSDTKLVVRWEGSTYVLAVRILRSRIGTLLHGGTGYHTTLEFVLVPDAVKELITRFMDSGTVSSAASGEGIQA